MIIQLSQSIFSHLQSHKSDSRSWKFGRVFFHLFHRHPVFCSCTLSAFSMHCSTCEKRIVKYDWVKRFRTWRLLFTNDLVCIIRISWKEMFSKFRHSYKRWEMWKWQFFTRSYLNLLYNKIHTLQILLALCSSAIYHLYWKLSSDALKLHNYT